MMMTWLKDRIIIHQEAARYILLLLFLLFGPVCRGIMRKGGGEYLDSTLYPYPSGMYGYVGKVFVKHGRVA